MGFTIPTYFTAEDRFSGVVRGMGQATESFSLKAEAALAKSERAFRKLTPVLGHAAKEFLEMASTAAIAAGIVKGVEFSFESVEKYEEKMANLKATTGLSGKAFEEYNDKILEVAKSSKKSAIDVADVFTIIEKANPELKDNAEKMGEIADASILMAKAAGIQLAPAAESLTVVMNKMGLEAEETASMVDIFAAASLAGKYKITELADGLTQFGATAKSMGMSVIEDTALLQLSSTFRAAGEGASESGAHIRKFLIALENMKTVTPQTRASLEHMGVHTKALASSTVSLADKLEMLQKIQSKGALIDKLFGPRNAEYVKGLLSHAGALDGIMEKTNEHGKAEELAAVREDTLSESLNRLKSAWINMLIGNGKAGEGLTIFQRAIEFVTEHLDGLVTIGEMVVGFFIVWKGLLVAGKIAMAAYNIGLGIYNALTATATVYTEAQSLAMASQAATTELATIATEGLNMAMLASPFGIAIGVIGLLGLSYLGLSKDIHKAAKEQADLNEQIERSFHLKDDYYAEKDRKEKEKNEKIESDRLKAMGGDLPFGNTSVGTKEYKMNDDGTSDNIPEVNSKDVHHKAVMSKMEQTNHAKATITIKDPNGRTETTGGGPGIEIKTVSTHPAH
jgi:TP901 family phage tail tape measure protein